MGKKKGGMEEEGFSNEELTKLEREQFCGKSIRRSRTEVKDRIKAWSSRL